MTTTNISHGYVVCPSAQSVELQGRTRPQETTLYCYMKPFTVLCVRKVHKPVSYSDHKSVVSETSRIKRKDEATTVEDMTTTLTNTNLILSSVPYLLRSFSTVSNQSRLNKLPRSTLVLSLRRNLWYFFTKVPIRSFYRRIKAVFWRVWTTWP